MLFLGMSDSLFNLQYQCSLVTADMESAFPAQTQPAIAMTDFMRDLTPNAVAARDRFKIDPQLHCGFAQPIFIPHNQVSGASGVVFVDDGDHLLAGVPNVTWSAITITGSYAGQAFANKSWFTQEYDIKDATGDSADTLSVSATATALMAQGFVLMLSRNIFGGLDPTATTTPYWECRFTIGDRLYSVRGGTTDFARLGRSDDGGATWKTLNAKLRVGGNSVAHMGNVYPASNAELIAVEVFTINSKLMVSVGGAASAIVLQLPDPTPYPTVTEVTVNAAYFSQFGWHLHPYKFACVATMTSAQKQLGFLPTSLLYSVTSVVGGHNLADGAHYTEIGSTITVGTDGGLSATPQYDLMIENPPATLSPYAGTAYANKTAAISRVTLRTPSLSRVYPYTPQPVVPQEIVESISFDPSSLQIRHSLSITMDNFKGIDWLWQQYGIRGYGNQHIAFRCGWQHMQGGPDGGIGWQHFYGYATSYQFSRGSGGAARLTMSCTDQMQQLEDVLIAAPADVDGFNHYSAMALYLMNAGITPLQMAFAHLVPTISGRTLLSEPGGAIDPYGVAPGDPTPGGYTLPYGTGMHPWTPIDRTLPILALLQPIQKVTGYLLYVDAFGFFRYEPWIPPSAIGPKRTFTETATDGWGQPGGALTEMFDLTITSSTDSTRNQTILVGIDAFGPEWAPIVEKRRDEPSIFTAPGDLPPRNHISYPKSVIWTDARFANPQFASDSADRLHAMVRLPDYTANFSCWLQPDLFPMDVIYVDDWKSNSLGVPFYVLSVVNRMSVLGDNLTLRSQIGGKYLI
jgi:hypothetical protein